MTIIQMRYFYEVCRWQNITKAAENLHVAQPTISVAMQALETETGLNLFRRNGKKILISKDGNLLLARIKAILEEMDHLQHEINDLAHKRNHIRLALPPQISVPIIPLLLGKFRCQYPEIIVELIEMAPLNSLQLLKDEKLDLALMNYTTDCAEGFTYRKLTDSECCFCTYSSHPLAKQTCVAIEDLKNEPLILFNSNFNLTNMIQQTFIKEKIKANILHYSPYFHTVVNLVRQKQASTFLMRHAIMPEDDIVALSMAEPLYLEAGIVTKKGRQIYSDERILMNFIKKNFV